jgi:DNA uptake protein ComE-like DNA-binding protein
VFEKKRKKSDRKKQTKTRKSYVIETSTTMSKPTYINKATLEELTSIAGIGEIRAQKMLKKKQENGSYLTFYR